MKYYIAIEEQRSTVVEVEANNVDEAIDMVAEAYCNNDICLDNGYEYVNDGTHFYDETEEWKSCINEGFAVNFIKI